MLDKAKNPAVSERYGGTGSALEHGWRLDVPAMRIETHAHARAGAAVTNAPDFHTVHRSQVDRLSLSPRLPSGRQDSGNSSIAAQRDDRRMNSGSGCRLMARSPRTIRTSARARSREHE
ncbi:hypothetical protein DIE01_00150 [Burkholderia sp. Bp8990]|nr:hypothetical protein DIE01_00150 [Burkholderia sp. Bp8990]